jgi:hypothetical protein
LKLPTNAAPAANTGAFQVWGGGSFSSNLYVGGAMTINGSQTSTYDFKVAGANSTNLLWARPNSAGDAVIVGNTLSAGSIVSGATFQINTTDSILLPSGTSGQRPSSPTAGMLRYRSDSASIEYYNGSTWQSPGGSTSTVITSYPFTGTGSQTTFTLGTSATTASVMVSINGVVQIPVTAYSVSGTTLTFTEAPASTDVIDARVISAASSITNIADGGSGYNNIAASAGTGIIISTGITSSVQQYIIDTNGGFATYSPNVTVASSGTATAVDNLYANTYSSAEYTITATIQNSQVREITKVLMVHSSSPSGGGAATALQYSNVCTAGNSLVAFSAQMTGNIAQLTATTTNANTILRIKRNYQAI